jgi:hypothetical protein
MNYRELEHYFSKKLRFEKIEKKSHTHFVPRINGRISFPSVFCISRGSGDVANNIVRHCAKSLGLREAELRVSERCRIGMACVYLCFAIEVIARCVADPIVHGNNTDAMLQSVERLLEAIDALANHAECWNDDESAVLIRVVKVLGPSGTDARLERVKSRIGAIIASRQT